MYAALILALAQSPVPPAAPTQSGFPGNPTGFRPKVEIPFNRFYDYPELLAWMDKLEAAFPKLMRHELIGDHGGPEVLGQRGCEPLDDPRTIVVIGLRIVKGQDECRRPGSTHFSLRRHSRQE